MRRLVSTWIAGAGLLSGGCGIGPPEDPPPLFLLVSVDTLRADRLGFYGNSRMTSPHLDAFARESVVFESAQTTAPWTLPAHASLLSGRYPSRHGLLAHGGRLRAEVPTLASILSDAGWATASIVNSRHLGERSGIQRGFERHFIQRDSARQVGATRELVDRALDWIDEERERPLFLFVHTFDAHSDYRSAMPHRGLFEQPYDGHVAGYTAQLLAHREGQFPLEPEDIEYLRSLYDASLHQLDAELGRLFDGLRRSGRLESSLVILTSDHGEEFLDHGDVLHGRNHHQAVVRVPLLIRHPDLPAGLRVATPVSLVDILPTALARLGVPTQGDFDGRDLAALWEEPASEAPVRDLFVEGDHNREPPGVLASVRRGHFKLHLDRSAAKAQLYDLAADPGETRNLLAERPEVAEALRRSLDRFLEEAPQIPRTRPLSDAERVHLESLGYLAAERRSGSGPEEDEVLTDQHHQSP